MRFTAQQAGHADLAITLNLAGVHNVRNALAAMAVARELEVADAPIAAALAAFAGVGRRFQRHGELAHGRWWPAPRSSTTTATTRWRWPPCWPPRAAPSRAGAWCWPSSRTATPARATASTTSPRVLQGFDEVLLTEVYAAGEAPHRRHRRRSTLAAAVPQRRVRRRYRRAARRAAAMLRATVMWSSPWAPARSAPCRSECCKLQGER